MHSNTVFWYIVIIMSLAKRIFLTGANRGLGKQLTQYINQHHPSCEMYLASRGPAQSLADQWRKLTPNLKVSAYQLEINKPESVRSCSDLLKNKRQEFDAIIANAGYGFDRGQTMPSVQTADNTLITNLDSTINFIKEFLPLLDHKGRVIVVSSIMGSLLEHSKTYQQRLLDPNITEEEILEISKDYRECARKKDMKDYSWSAYRISKTLLNSWCRFVLPKYLKKEQSFVCMHPGWCSTDMGGKNALLSAEEGGKRINQTIWLERTERDKFYNTRFCDYFYCQ